jgi:hypothetical protein
MGDGGRSMATSVCTPASSSGTRSVSTSRYSDVFTSACTRPSTGGGVRTRDASAAAARDVAAARFARHSVSFCRAAFWDARA